MGSGQKFLLVKTVAFVTLWITLCGGDSILRYMNINDDNTGNATNCGKEPFLFSWTPKVMSAKYSETFHFKIITKYKIDGGAYNLTLTEWGQSEPFLVYANPFTCDDLKSLKVPCPLPAGIPIDVTKNFDDTKYLLSFPGRYILQAKLHNHEGQELICAKMDITIDNY